MRVVVGLSGGVDSAVAAYLLRREGHEVIGVTLRTWETGESRCCAIDRARETAEALGIPFSPLNCVSAFQREVETPFLEGYLRGITPNPCVLCNRAVKWEWLLYAAELFRAEAVATGHYAAVSRRGDRVELRRGADAGKDQSYMLWRLSQEALARTILPLGALTKAEVRRIACEARLPSADAPDSQEVCFVTEGDYGDYLERTAPERMPGAGRFVDAAGKPLGTHRGYPHYTIGQRRGLGLALGERAYVLALHPEKNEVVVGPEAALYKTELLCTALNAVSAPLPPAGGELEAQVQLRSHHPGAPALLRRVDEESLLIRFAAPHRAPAPGQSAVFYNEKGCLLGGGIVQ